MFESGIGLDVGDRVTSRRYASSLATFPIIEDATIEEPEVEVSNGKGKKGKFDLLEVPTKLAEVGESVEARPLAKSATVEKMVATNTVVVVD
ncbi:hypothetical protein VNO78_02933 [Psophocarpus tetragonolobus]|uniref:Uncharacterized protein n=1 Tax=Psophocarpus tetragonolobus TaxID=3891 RepID=A0AAN9T090_PSOTE